MIVRRGMSALKGNESERDSHDRNRELNREPMSTGHDSETFEFNHRRGGDLEKLFRRPVAHRHSVGIAALDHSSGKFVGIVAPAVCI